MPDAQALLKQYQPRSVRSFNLDRQMSIVRFSPCGNFLVAAGLDANIRRWDAAPTPFADLPPLTGHRGWVQALAFHPDRRRLFTGDSWGELRAWNYAEREPQCVLTQAGAHDGWIRSLAISGDGRLLATCGRDKKVCIWTVEGKKLHELTAHNDDVFCVAFHPDNRSLVSGDQHGNIFQWDVTTGQKTRDLNARVLYMLSRLQDVGGVRRLEFNSAGTVLAAAGTRPSGGGNVQGVPTILLFDWKTGQVQHTLAVGGEGDGFVYDLAFHSGGFVMAVTSGNPGAGKFFFHQPGDAAPFFLHTGLPNCQSLAVHPNGNRLVVASTNAGSNGNGRQLRNGEYPGNFSPLHVWEIPQS